MLRREIRSTSIVKRNVANRGWALACLATAVALVSVSCDPSAARIAQSVTGSAGGQPSAQLAPEQSAAATAPPTMSSVVIPIPDSDFALRAVLFRPNTLNPTPAILILPGTEGFTYTYTLFAREFADRGYTAMAACWFKATQDSGPAAYQIPCEAAPDFSGAQKHSLVYVAALFDYLYGLDWVDKNHVSIYGQSRGATMALHAAADPAFKNLHAVVSAGALVNFQINDQVGVRDDLPLADAAKIDKPVLLIHAKDDPLVAWTQSEAEQDQLLSTHKLANLKLRLQAWFPDTGGHQLHVSRPTEVIDVAAEFLATN